MDLMKGIAAVLVLIGHSIQYSPIDEKITNELFAFVYSFHMPLFILLSGYCARFGAKKSAFEILVKRNICLSLPILVWGTENYIYTMMQQGNSLVLTMENIQNWIISITRGGFWFLYVAIFCNTIGFVVIRQTKHKAILLGCGTWLALLLLSELDPCFSKFAFLWPYYFLGIYLSKIKSEFEKEYNIILAILSFVFPLFLLYYNQDCYIYTTGIGLSNSTLSYTSHIIINIYRYFIGLSGCAFCYYIMIPLFNITKNLFKTCFIYFGKHSLEYYVMQNALFRYAWNTIKSTGGGQTFTIWLLEKENVCTFIVVPIVAFIVIGIMELFIFFIKKLPKCISLFVFGRKTI